MSSRNWRIVFVAVGWLILANPLAAESDNRSKEAVQQNPSGDISQAAHTAIPSPQTKTHQTPIERCKGTDKPELPCDAISAQAAIDQARDAHRQILIGWVQAAGLVASLFCSALATRAAFKAVREAEKGSQASLAAAVEAQKANRIASDTAKRQLRAYLTLSKISLYNFEVGNAPRAHIIFINAGQTPAYKTVATFKLGWSIIPPNEKWFSQKEETDETVETEKPSSGAVGPQREMNCYPRFGENWSADKQEAFGNGIIALYAFGTVTYEDAFGRAHSTDIRLVHDRTCPLGSFHHCASGNDET